MKKSNKSPMTSFNSFEELAQNLEGFDYEKAKEAQEFQSYKKNYNVLAEYGKLLKKLAYIDDKRQEYYNAKNDMDFLHNVESKKQLDDKILNTFAKGLPKSNKEKSVHEAAGRFNNLKNYLSTISFIDIQSQAKVNLIASEQALKESRIEMGIREYSETLKLAKKYKDFEFCDSAIYEAKDEKAYHYAKMLQKFIIYFSGYSERHCISYNIQNFSIWLKNQVYKYEYKVN